MSAGTSAITINSEEGSVQCEKCYLKAGNLVLKSERDITCSLLNIEGDKGSSVNIRSEEGSISIA